MAKKLKSKLVWAVVCLGLIVALITFLENYWPWLAALCGVFGSGCRQAADFTLFRIPIPIWGIGFYVALAIVHGFLRNWTFRLVMIGVGVEATLVWLMLSRDIVCLFCLLNAFVVAILLLMFIKWRQLWQCIAIALIAYLASGYLLVRENPPPNPNQSDLRGDSLVAEVNGHRITLADLEGNIATKLYKKRDEVYRLKRQQLENIIKLILADERGIALDDKGEALSISEEEQKALISETRKVLFDILSHQPHIDQLMEIPPLPFTSISIGNSPSLGPLDAPVTVIEFSDYLCPACRWAHPIGNEIRNRYQGKIRWVFKDYPLTIHPGADKLAAAARCADDQGRFWEFQDLLYAAPKDIEDGMLAEFAMSLEMDVGSFNQCVENETYAQDVLNDKQSAIQAGVRLTPSYLINGRLNPGSMSPARFRQRIEEALARDARQSAPDPSSAPTQPASNK